MQLVDYLQSSLRIRQLSAVIAVDEYKSISRASKELHLTQPALTRNVQELERALGGELFERTAKGVATTLFGNTFIKHARLVMGHVHDACVDVHKLSTGDSGQVVVGVSASLPKLLSMAIACFKEAHPAIAVRIMHSDAENLISALRAGDVDFIVGQHLDSWEYAMIDHEVLYDDDLVLVSNGDHPFQKLRRSLTDDELMNAQWALPLRRTALRTQLESTLEEIGLDLPTNVIEIMSVDVIIELLKKTEMIALLPRQAVRGALETGFLAIVPFEYEFMHNPISIALNRMRILTPAAKSFCRYVKEAALEL